jgi:hypothetical protein
VPPEQNRRSKHRADEQGGQQYHGGDGHERERRQRKEGKAQS